MKWAFQKKDSTDTHGLIVTTKCGFSFIRKERNLLVIMWKLNGKRERDCAYIPRVKHGSSR